MKSWEEGRKKEISKKGRRRGSVGCLFGRICTPPTHTIILTNRLNHPPTHLASQATRNTLKNYQTWLNHYQPTHLPIQKHPPTNFFFLLNTLPPLLCLLFFLGGGALLVQLWFRKTSDGITIAQNHRVANKLPSARHPFLDVAAPLTHPATLR